MLSSEAQMRLRNCIHAFVVGLSPKVLIFPMMKQRSVQFLPASVFTHRHALGRESLHLQESG